jgi:hypothetical protein
LESVQVVQGGLYSRNPPPIGSLCADTHDAPGLLIFDCDGVLIGSEVIACRTDPAYERTSDAQKLIVQRML